MLKRFAVCGVSNRAIGMFIRPMVQTFADSCQLVGLLDSDQRRFDVCKSKVPGIAVVPEFRDDQFGQMLVKAKPDTIIVTSRDDTHVDYIVQALEHNLDVITEKPMATTAKDCQRIIEAEAKSLGKVTVTFNYRYSLSYENQGADFRK